VEPKNGTHAGQGPKKEGIAESKKRGVRMAGPGVFKKEKVREPRQTKWGGVDTTNEPPKRRVYRSKKGSVFRPFGHQKNVWQ